MSTPEQQFERFRRSSDPAALAAVFDTLAPELLLIAAHVAGAEAEDLVQATFLDAIEKRERWDAARPLLPWLIGILVNHARAERRRRTRRDAAGDSDGAPLPATEPPPIEQLASAELRQQLAAAMGSLPRSLRVVVTMRLAHGLTPTEIAHTLGCPVATVKTKLQRGRAWLRRALPSGVALGATAVIAPGASLAAARAAVLHRATALAGAGVPAVGAIVLGGVLMKKMTIAAAALLCLGGLLWSWQLRAVTPTSPAPAADSPALAAVGALPANDATPPGARVPAAVREDASPDAAPTWNLQVVLASTQEPVRGAAVYFLPPRFDPRQLGEEERAFHDKDHDAWLQQFGRVSVSDGEGRCEIPLDEWGMRVSAYHGGLYGSGFLAADAPAPTVLPLRPDRSLTIRVCDVDDRAVQHALVLFEDVEGNAGRPTQCGRTDEAGLLVLRHTQMLGGASGARMQFYARVPGCTSAPTIVDLQAPPAVVEVRLPATGSVTVHLRDADDRPLDPDFLQKTILMLLSYDERPDPAPKTGLMAVGQAEGMRDPVTSATIEFPHVGLGRYLVARLTPNHSVEGIGPTDADRHVELILREDAHDVIVTGRLLDPDGAPLARRDIYFEASSTSGSVGTLLRTTAEGRVRLDLGARDAGGDFTLRLGPTPGSIEAWPTGLRQQKLTAGCNDLGDFQLRPAPIVVSGRALIEDAPAVLDVPLMTRIENGGRWRVATELRATWLADGRFVIRGNVAADTRLQLLVKDGPYRTLGALDCVAGATDLEVRLRAVPERGGR